MNLSRKTSRRIPSHTLVIWQAIALCGGWFASPWHGLAAEPTTELARKLANVSFDHFALAPGYSEGPTWAKGEVFFCSGALWRVDADNKVHRHLDINPAGTVLTADGRLLICDNKHRALLSLSPEGQVDVLVEQFEARPLRSLNDLTLDARGNVYWTDPEGSSPDNPIGSIFRLRPDGRVDRIATGMAFPNGLDVDPANKFLYVIESQTKKILRFDLPADDKLCGSPVDFFDLGGSGGDGCAFDAEGNLWVADFHRPESGFGRITVLSPAGKAMAYLPVPAKLVSNIAFGGPDHDEIFCTTADPPGVFHAKVGMPGFAGHAGKPLPVARTLDVVVRRPHAEAELVQKIMAIAAAAEMASDKFPPAALAEIQSQLAALADADLSAKLKDLLPGLEQAAARRANDQPLLNEIKRLNGKATFETRAPKWLRAIVGDDALPVFARIVEIDLNERTDGHKAPEPKALSERANNDTLKLLAGQDALRRLELSGTAVTSEGLIHLKELNGLQILNVCLTNVSDAGFEHLAGLTDMKRMVVCASKITGSGFKHLGGMKQIESINLHSSPASDEGLEAIGKLTSLKRLEIVHTHVTDAGLARLASLVNLRQFHVHGPETTADALPLLGQWKQLYELDVYDRAASNQTLAAAGKLPQLRFLRFFNGHFDDKGVQSLVGLQTLEELVLHSAGVTDASIPAIGKLRNLRVVQLTGSKVTDAGKAQLKTLLPEVEIR